MNYSEEILNSHRNEQDAAADKVVNTYFTKDKQLLQGHLAALTRNDSKLPVDADQSLIDLLGAIQLSAGQIDLTELNNGQAFFSKYASDVMLLLGFMSLPYCYAAKYGAEVLVRSKRILENPAKRLMDTAEFVFDVTHPDAFKPNGKALISIIKVRLLHATTRWYINQDKTWDTETFGKPVNQEDMAGTNLSFSLITVRGLRKLGKPVLPIEAFHYINYWNKIGGLLGVVPELLPENNREASVLERNIRKRQFATSDAGNKLTMSLLKYYEVATVDTPIEGMSKSFMNYLIGDSISSLIGLKIEDYDRIVFKPFRLFISFQGYFFNAQDSYAKAYARFKEAKH